jgi:2-polyprenyl-6-methoxyphenol hydroxylase-like FAD-dependent oxidoreductase
MLPTTFDDARAEASGRAPAADAAPAQVVDVAVVGAGLSGSVAAVTLARAGYRVALIDRHEICPPQFRVEKFGGEQADGFRRLGLLDAIAAVATPFHSVVNVLHGKVVDHTNTPYYAVRYEQMVQAVREQLPPAARFLVGEVRDVAARADGQRVVLASGEVIDARLTVIATGMGDALWEQLGMVRRATFEKHSVTFGFDIAPPAGGRFIRSAITYYGEGASDRIDYLTLFPLGDIVRANLFTFLADGSPSFREFRRSPKEALLRAMPGLPAFLGDFEVASRVQSWVMNLYEVEHYERDGVVLIGDAFRTSCPAAGTGVSRLLTDVERLCLVYAPDWLASPGMGADKVGAFYRDDAKLASDRRALKLSHGRRSLTLVPTLQWQARRRQQFLRRRVAEWFRSRGAPAAAG